METKKHLNVPLPAQVYDDFRVISKSKGMKLTEAVRRFIYEEVEKHRQEKARKELEQAGKPVTKVLL